MNKEVNRHLRDLTYDNVTLDNYSAPLPFVHTILNSNHNDRLKISASQLLFGNILKLDRLKFFLHLKDLLLMTNLCQHV